MTPTVPFLKPFLLSLESTLTLNTNIVTRTATWIDPSAESAGCQSSYVEISAQYRQKPRVGKRSNIWVRTDVGV